MEYQFEVAWSDEDASFIGTCPSFPSLSWAAHDEDEARAGIKSLVEEVIADMRANGETPPTPTESP